MKATLNGKSYDFRPWRPEMGCVFSTGYAFDSETTLIDQDRPWITPAYVLGAAFGDADGYFITRDHAAAFFRAHEKRTIVMHHAAFDLGVIHALAPEVDIYRWVDRNLVRDTQILRKLLMLGTEGHTASSAGESTLETCARRYLGIELPKDVNDSQGKVVRLSYGQWLGRPAQEIEPIYLEYLAKDAVVTRLLHAELWRRLGKLLDEAGGTWGYVSSDWLAEQRRRWGPQTHNIQIRASIVLQQITNNGLHLDMTRRDKLVAELHKIVAEKRRELAEHGYLPGKGSVTALQNIFRRLEGQHPELSFTKTDNGRYATSQDALSELSGTVPFIRLFLEYQAVEKLLSCFLGKMGRGVLHASFNVLARTGRTTSFGEINAQNLPQDDRVRSCFVPSPDHVFIDADYKTIELATLAQGCQSQFGLESAMAVAINAGQDLHRLVAARVLGKPESQISASERAMAKPINFGKPGGMSDRTLKSYAKATYGVDLDDDQVAALSRGWSDQFPEMAEFLADSVDIGQQTAEMFNLTLESHWRHTGSDRFLKHPDNQGQSNAPYAILGGMMLKAIKEESPQTRAGRPYPAGDVDYFWTRLAAKADLLPAKHRAAVQARRPSPQLQRAVLGLVGRAGVFTLTGRLRAKASYCARHNTVFQGLAADGAKLALWMLWRAGYRIANFIHDQVLVEVPADSDLKAHAESIRRLMIEGMKQVVPDVLIDVSYAATDRWHKDAKAVFDGSGTRLVIWR